MAAQPLVLESYKIPLETFDVNVMGTVNILDIAFKKNFVKAIIVVTTDKVYRNDNSGRAFVESDPLEGKDPYSASKVGTEAVVAAWQQIAKVSGGPKVVSVRAGNVIGGGDFAEHRIIPDLIRGIMSGLTVEIRNPNSTRPWQHVLDPIGGYLLALEEILNFKYFSSLNFSSGERSLSVAEVIEIATSSLEKFKIEVHSSKSNNGKNDQVESIDLNLDSNLASRLLGWRSSFTQHESVNFTVNWWNRHLRNDLSPKELCNSDIQVYLERIKSYTN
jgi:CDP-glucose 4,6-dehydratase